MENEQSWNYIYLCDYPRLIQVYVDYCLILGLAKQKEILYHFNRTAVTS